MSVVIHEHSRVHSYASSRFSATQTWPRRLIIVVAGCLAMAASGVGLGAYLDTSSAVAADSAQAADSLQTADMTPPADAPQTPSAQP